MRGEELFYFVFVFYGIKVENINKICEIGFKVFGIFIKIWYWEFIV